jgi:hypothetical protein
VKWIFSALVAFSLPVIPAQATTTNPKNENIFQITRVRETKQQTEGGGSSSSFDRDSIVQRIIGQRESGLELVYDLPDSATSLDRRRVWQFPARVLKPSLGPLQLLNGPELEIRVDKWLKWGKMKRAACGKWVFTWNAFRIECDPQSVLQAVASFEFGIDELREGEPFHFPGALGAAPLQQTSDGSTFTVTLQVDPEAVKKEEAESDIVVAEIMKKPLTFDAALRARSSERISGTISITFNRNASGEIWRRTMVKRIEVTNFDEQTESRTVSETLERRPISAQEIDAEEALMHQ